MARQGTTEPTERARVRPVALPPEEELALAARGTWPLRELLALADWFASERRLTGTGMPRPDDIRALATDLDLWPGSTEEQAAERAERLKRLRAARDLPEFLALWRAAVDLGLIEVDSGRARACAEVREGLSPQRALDAWVDLFERAIAGEPGTEDLFHVGRFGSGLIRDLLDDLYAEPDDTEISLSALATSIVEELARPGAQLSGASEELIDHSRRMAHMTLYQTALGIGAGGGIRLIDHTGEEVRAEFAPEKGLLPIYSLTLDESGDLDESGSGPRDSEIVCAAALTPLGRYGVRRMFLAEGVEAPLLGGLARAGAVELLDALRRLPRDVRVAQIKAWAALRTAEEAVAEIAEACAEPTGDGAVRRIIASEVLRALGGPALPPVRVLLASDRPAVAGLAASTLIGAPDLPQAEVEEVIGSHGLWFTIDSAAGLLHTGESALAGALKSEDPGEGLPFTRLLFQSSGEVWRGDHPQTLPVLDAVGRLHPDRKVAKAARRAAYKARSRA